MVEKDQALCFVFILHYELAQIRVVVQPFALTLKLWCNRKAKEEYISLQVQIEREGNTGAFPCPRFNRPVERRLVAVTKTHCPSTV